MQSKHWVLAWTALVLVLTLQPASPITGLPEDLPSVWCVVCGGRGGADGILNFGLFLPLGFALMAATGRPLRSIVLAVLLSIMIEFLQGVIPGRYPTLGDVVFNGVGGSAGVGLARMRETLLRPSRRLAGAFTLGTAAVAAALLLLAGVLFSPSVPDTVYCGQWTADLGFLEAYEGRVLEASLGSLPLPSQRTKDPALAVDLVRSGAPLRARVIAGPAPSALAPIVSIFDEYQTGVLILGADATDLVLWLRYRANDLRLDRPDLRARRAFAATRPGDTLGLVAARTSGGYALQLDQREYAPLRHTPGEGWALLLPLKHLGPWAHALLNLAWVAGLLVLAGWWAPGPGWAAGAVAIALGGMVMAAILGPLTGIATAEILAAVGGVTLGRALRAFWPEGRPLPAAHASVEQRNIHERAQF